MTSILRRRLVLGSFIGLATGIARAAPEAQFQSALETFLRASDGDTAAIEPAADAFATLLGRDPANPVLMAYAGAATAMRASTTLLPWKKMSHAEEGLAMLDKALALLTPAHDAPIQRGVPGSLEVRFIAATTFVAVPGFMNRGARGAKLFAEVQASPLFAGAPLGFRGSVWMRAAKQAAKEQHVDDARRLYALVIEQKAPQAERAAVALKGLGS